MELQSLRERPLISVVMPTYETDPRHLREAIGSVVGQEYPDWELWIVDDCSSNRLTQREIERWVARDERITARRLERNSGISAASNEALSLCRGELVAFLDHDDVLTADALLQVAGAFTRGEIDVVYTDQDKITADGHRTDPFLKPDWSPVYALGAMYVGHLLVARTELIREVGGLDSDFDRIQDFELLLRLSERTNRIHHIDRILYHWRAIPGSIALGAAEKPGIVELQARAVNDHLHRRGVAARAEPHPSIAHRLRLRPAPGAGRPPVTIVIPARTGARRTLETLLRRTDYPGLEVILVNPEWADGSAATPAGAINVIDPGDVTGERRAGVPHASGEWLLFLGEHTEVTQPEWIERLLAHAQIPSVGAVAPTLTRPDGLVEAAGVAIGLYDPAVPVLRGHTADGDGYYGSLSCAREVSAVGMECLLVRRSAFEQAGGFEEAYSREHQSHDLSMRLAEGALSSVCVPVPRTISHASEAWRLADFDVIDRALFVDRWYEQPGGRRPLLQPRLLPRRRRLHAAALRRGPAGDRAAGGHRVRVLFLHFGELHVNSVIQTFHLGEQMTAEGVEVALCGRGTTDRIAHGRRAELRAASPTRRWTRSSGTGLANPIETMICAWTPREVVRRATERAAAILGAPYVVHLEDNEEHLISSALRLPYEELSRLPRERHDRLSHRRPHPPGALPATDRGRPGLTLITEELDAFNFAARPYRVARPGVDHDRFRPDLKPSRLARSARPQPRRLRARLPRHRALRESARAVQPVRRREAASASRAAA